MKFKMDKGRIQTNRSKDKKMNDTALGRKLER